MSPPATRGHGALIGGHAPLLHGAWENRRVDAAFLLALLPPLVAALYLRGEEFCWLAALAVVVALAWQALFAILRGSPRGWNGLLGALTFALLVPEAAQPWQQALALSFGVVMGEQVFGGRGWSFLNPAVVGLAFMLFSFPGLDPEPAGAWLTATSLPGAVLLLAFGLVSWRVLAAIVVGLAGSALAIGGGVDWQELCTGTMVFGMVFLACDPVSAAATNSGRWAYGLLTGALAIIFGQGSGAPGSVHALVFALLLGGIFAPLIDRTVVACNIRRRRARNG